MVHLIYKALKAPDLQGKVPVPMNASEALKGARKGTSGVSTSGVTADFMFFDRGFWGTPVNLL